MLWAPHNVCHKFFISHFTSQYAIYRAIASPVFPFLILLHKARIDNYVITPLTIHALLRVGFPYLEPLLCMGSLLWDANTLYHRLYSAIIADEWAPYTHTHTHSLMHTPYIESSVSPAGCPWLSRLPRHHQRIVWMMSYHDFISHAWCKQSLPLTKTGSSNVTRQVYLLTPALHNTS